MASTVFISYAREDRELANTLFTDLKSAGVEPWLDSENLRPGEKWKESIKETIRESDYFLALISRNSIDKRGFVQRELKFAIEVLEEFPSHDIFIIPVRLEKCRPKESILTDLNWVDLFPNYDRGLSRLLSELCAESRRSRGPRIGGLAKGGLVLVVAALLSLALYSAQWQPAGFEPETRSKTLEEAEDSKNPRTFSPYVSVPLKTDLSDLSIDRRAVLGLLIDAANEMDEVFWIQTFGNKEGLLANLVNSSQRAFVEANYGPWDRIDGNAVRVHGYSEKPRGANFYPGDISLAELQEASKKNPAIQSKYTMVRRDPQGQLVAHPYSIFFEEYNKKAALKLLAAAQLETSVAFRDYLEKRANALLTNIYYPSDIAWMGASGHWIDIIIGPIEVYEDQLWNTKASNEAYVLLRNEGWSDRLSRYVSLLPVLQRSLPVAEAYRRQEPGLRSELAVYDAIYYAGACNAGPKPMSVTLPNESDIQTEYGSRRLLFRNVMEQKFENILAPIATQMLAEGDLPNVDFEAFFLNTLFHEIAHGLGVKYTLADGAPVEVAMGDHAATIEEAKADVLGLYMVMELSDQGELQGTSLERVFTTSLASTMRSIRFGNSSDHGIANLIRFNYFLSQGAIVRDDLSRRYRLDLLKTRLAIRDLTGVILRLQGDSDYKGAVSFLGEFGLPDPELDQDLEILNLSGVPVDLVFNQGKRQLGLETAWPRGIRMI